MNKPFKILSSTAVAAALATTAIVPAASADAPIDVPAQAKALDKVVFESKGQLVSLNVLDHAEAVAANAIDSKPTHVTAKDGSVYTITDYSEALAANKTPEKALEKLYADGAYVDAKIVNGKLVDRQVVAENDVVAPELDEKLNIEVVDKIVADGVTTEVVKFQLLDKTGNVDKTANDVVLEIGSTYGFLSQTRLTIQNGEGEVILRSEFLKKETEAKITGQVIEAKDSHKDLIGKVAGEKKIKFIPAGSGQSGEQVVIKKVTAANSNEADRVTLFFDEEVTMEDFYKTDDNGLVINKNTNEPILLDNIKVQQKDGSVLTNKDIRAIVLDPTEAKQATVVLEKGEPGKRPNILQDNKDVYVEFTDTLNKNQKSNTEFKLADARVANVTSVNYVDPKTITVTFSEPIEDANFLIDGQFAEDTFEAIAGDLEYKNGEWVDTRHIVTIELNDNYMEKNGQKGYFTSGIHALETSNIRDFAALSDPKNVGSTQVLEFEVPSNNEQVLTTRTVDSPEQFRVSFNKDIKLSKDKGKSGEKVTESNFFDLVDFQVWSVYEEDGELKGKWVSVDDYTFAKENGGKNTLKDKYKVTQLKDEQGKAKNEFKVELLEDWTKVYETSKTKQNYYNDTFRFFIDEEKLMTASNGKVNEKGLDLRLTTINGKDTALATADITSPVINTITPIFDETNKDKRTVKNFVVEMSEPVKLKGKKDDSGSETLAESQASLPETKVEFHGTYTDKFGKVTPYTFPGVVNGYVENGLDNKIDVMWEDTTGIKVNGTAVKNPQEFVNAGGSEDFKVVVKSISDDVGNTAATVNKPFTLKAHKDAPGVFQVKPESGNAIGDNTWATATKGSNDQFAVAGELATADGQKDKVTITYTEAVAFTGLGSATDVKNYALNGKDLPTGSSIALAKGTDNVVVISAPKGTLNSGSNVITLAKQISSKAGEQINYDLSFTFKTTKDDTPQTPGANKKELTDLINNAKNADETGKTPEAVKALNDVVLAAEKVQENEDATQAEVDQAVKDLQAALDKFNNEKPTDPEQPVDKKALETALENAKDADKEGKTPESVKALEDAIEEAKAVLEDADATQEKVDEAAKALDQAVADLKDNPEEPGDTGMPVNEFLNKDAKVEVATLAPGVFAVMFDKADIKEEFKGQDFSIKAEGKTLKLNEKNNKVVVTVQTGKNEDEIIGLLKFEVK